VQFQKLYPFSFREYLFFKYDLVFPTISLMDIIEKRWDQDMFSHETAFMDYLQGGLLPFSLEEPRPLSILRNVVNTVIMKDIPSVERIRMDELEIIKRMLEFIGKSGVEGINYSSLSRNLGITKYKAEQYVRILEDAFILNRIFPKGANVLKEPKILMAVPYRLLYADYEYVIGGIREDFFVEMLKSLGLNFYYLKSKRGAKTPDYLVPCKEGAMVVEVGGKGKGRSQFKGIEVDKKLILSYSSEIGSLKRPLFLLGFVDRVE